VDILINNAGLDTLGPVSTTDFNVVQHVLISHQLHSQDPKNITKSLGVNLLGPYFLMRKIVPGFTERGHGCVINIASRAGTVDAPFNSMYSVAKSALIRLTSCWQRELDLTGNQGVHMYSIHPGAVSTDLTSAGMTPSI